VTELRLKRLTREQWDLVNGVPDIPVMRPQCATCRHWVECGASRPDFDDGATCHEPPGHHGICIVDAGDLPETAPTDTCDHWKAEP
jgi:hypothetical protein